MEIKGRKKALLIGILYRDFPSESQLPGAARDVEQLRDLLIDCYQYVPENIVVMTDLEGVSPEMKPTKPNILRELRLLLDGAGDHDHFLFHFSGHSDQLPSRSDTEEDQQDETIFCTDSKMIKDNTLRQMLVDRLPEGASLTAIFDSCHSGTLLDLEHYQCNNVWVPWVNKGRRKSDTLKNRIVRRNALYSTTATMEAPAYPEKTQSLDFTTRISGGSTKPDPIRRVRTLVTIYVGPFPEARHVGTVASKTSRAWLPEQPRSSSPIPMRERSCDGTCREQLLTQGEFEEKKHPLVVSISAARDNQTNWTDRGDTMTLKLVKILRNNCTISHRHLLTELNYSLYDFTRRLHRFALRQRRKSVIGNIHRTMVLEMNNFQEPQMGSITPLNMDDTFHL